MSRVSALVWLCVPTLCLALGVWLGVQMASHPDTPPDPPLPSDLLRAVQVVESNGDARAYNENEEAAGILQIRPIMVDEVNRILELEGRTERYTLEDRFDVARSTEMFTIYSMYWDSRHCDYTLEGRARRWNGGPDGHTEHATLTYWNKVKAEL